MDRMPAENDNEQLIAAEESRLRELERERDATIARIASLRAQADEPSAELSPTEKVRMFGELFQGRPDVFPRRWENGRTGRSGYAPACRNEWAAGVCGKPTVRCGACPNQAFEPFDGDVLLGHLRGRHIVGVYPLLEDDTCWFCAIDLDGAGWRDDARAVRTAAHELGIPVAVERSRSGDGAHVWIFFAERVPAGDARRLSSAVLTEATARRPSIGLVILVITSDAPPNPKRWLLLCQGEAAVGRVAVDRDGWQAGAGGGGLAGIGGGLQEVPDAAGEVAFEAAQRFAACFSFGLFACQVGGAFGVEAAFADGQAV
jgi:hypothetical protein